VGKQKAIFIIVLAFAFLAGISWAEPTSNNRPVDWANSVQMEGVPNFYKVSEDLYRSAQPTSIEAMRNLEISNLGIRTVVDLRWSKSNRDKIGGTGLLYEHIPMIGWPLFPKEEQVITFLQIVTDSQKTPILVYCQHGADRTGAMSAVYRIVVQGWTKEKALQEMIEGGFGFHGTRDGNVAQWINRLNIDRIKRRTGIVTNALP
jgi:protein tyrosine phosphatase (PTP) superfamily phosphohydrolase (DUF442 family)